MIKFLKDKFRKWEYKQYLKSDKWKRKRYAVLQRDGFRCVRCGSKNNLQVHHKTYRNIFNEPLSDLITLCKKCHKKQHGK